MIVIGITRISSIDMYIHIATKHVLQIFSVLRDKNVGNEEEATMQFKLV